MDPNRRITFWNRGAERLTGYESSEVVGRNCFDNLLSHVDGTGCPLCIMGCPLKWTMEDGEPREAEIYLRHKLGHRVPISVRVAPIKDSRGLTVGAVEIFTDISEKKRIERRAGELEGLAYRDPLTGLANRRFTELKVRQALEDLKQFNRAVGLIMIDLDEFKQVNDAYGHRVGDLYLQEVAMRMKRQLRSGDMLARLGGDEFAALLPLVCNRTQVEEIALRLERSFDDPFAVDGYLLRGSASVGVSMFPDDGITKDSLLSAADAAMYVTKHTRDASDALSSRRSNGSNPSSCN